MKAIAIATAGLILALSAHAQAPAAPGLSATKPAPAYYIAEFEPNNMEAIRPYSASVEDTFKPFSGRYVVRGGQAAGLEGEAPRGRMIVIAFDSLTQARAWYDSPAYREILPIRHSAGRTRAYIVEGLAQP
jgi:uncharacterized protein (DUF1330 family)